MIEKKLVKTPFDELRRLKEYHVGVYLTRDMISKIYDALCEELSEFDIKILGYKVIDANTGLEFIYGSSTSDAEYPTEKKGDIVERIHKSLDATGAGDRYNTLETTWGIYDINQTSNHHILVTWNQGLD